MKTKTYDAIDDQELLELALQVEKEIEPIFKNIDEVSQINSLKVIKAFQQCNLQEHHFNSSTGYGIDESGRNKIEEIYAQIFKTEDALVRTQFISGTHALSVALFGLLRPNDTMISLSGAPYDTLQTIIGCRERAKQKFIKSIRYKL